MAACALAGPAQRAQAAALLDAVFVTPRGRHPSFAERFPGAFTDDGTSAVVVAGEGEVVACAVLRLRRWAATHEAVATIGGVCTHPAHRRRGLASALVREAEGVAAAWGARDLVLWTAQPAFYERLGWTGDDPGRFGVLKRLAADGRPGTVAVDVGVRMAERIEVVRERGGAAVLARSAVDYRTVPFPARNLECLATPEAYALVGRDGDAAYVYEVEGATEELADLWAAIAGRYRTVCVNDRPGSASWAWLQARADVAWAPAPLALWKGGRRDYIPFVDRL